jgi:predicted acylesterase/phospholipase RssA
MPLSLGDGPAERAVWYVLGTVLRLTIVTVSSVVTVGLAWVWLNLSFLIAGSIYMRWRKSVPPWLRRWLDSAPAATAAVVRPSGDLDSEISAELENFTRIGIVLAGGGAKGAYQAGALRAVHEFLGQYGTLDKVKMIAGTSIGSWNALFWLAGLIGGEGDRDLLRLWWRNIKLGELVAPAKYAPGINFILSNRPWQDQFDAMFVTGPLRAPLERHVGTEEERSGVHFYFTRTNVGKARLEFTTNNGELDALDVDVLGRPSDGRGWRRWTLASSVEDVRFAVFSSMTLPPLFQYMTAVGDGGPDDTQYYEDGGVIDNLPIVFGTEVEACDLLFVFPLNASFEARVDTRWMWKRLVRVVNIRQAALEQKALADLRRLNKTKLGSGLSPVSVFAVCPEDDSLISTSHFWNGEGSVAAFDLMYRATVKALQERFVGTVRSRQPSVLLVDGDGEVRPREI